MAIQFCDDCGNTLPVLGNSTVMCDCCGKLNKNLLLSTTVTSTTSKFPSRLREKLTSTTQALTDEDKKANFPRINRQCPKCQRPEMTFSQAQLRSADEGTTIFYFCLGCGHRFKEDN